MLRTFETCPEHGYCVRVTDDDGNVEHQPARKGQPLPEPTPEERQQVRFNWIAAAPGAAALVWLIVETIT